MAPFAALDPYSAVAAALFKIEIDSISSEQYHSPVAVVCCAVKIVING
jgi:hypothetical protein